MSQKALECTTWKVSPGNCLVHSGVGAWKQCIKSRYSIWGRLSILISLTALKTHSGPILLAPPLWAFFPFCRAAVFWGSLLVCFLLFGFSSVADSFPSSLQSPSLFPPASFFPWRLLVFPHYRGSPMANFALHCSEGWVKIRRMCVDVIRCVFHFFLFFTWQKKKGKPYISAIALIFLSWKLMQFKEICLNVKRRLSCAG